jgi:predicted nucleotidyltransferase
LIGLVSAALAMSKILWKGQPKYLKLRVMERDGLGYKECKTLLKRLVALLRGAIGDELLSVALFGSVARGKAGKESDIDLLVIYEGDRRRVEKVFQETVFALREDEGYKELQAKGYRPDAFPVFMNTGKLRRHPWLLLDVADHGIILLDKGRVLKKELRKIKKRLRELGSKKVVLKDGTWYWDLKPDWKPGEVIEL